MENKGFEYKEVSLIFLEDIPEISFHSTNKTEEHKKYIKKAQEGGGEKKNNFVDMVKALLKRH